MKWHWNEVTNEWTSKRQADVIMINVRFKLISFHFVLRLVATYGMSLLYFSFVFRLLCVCVCVCQKLNIKKAWAHDIMDGAKSVATNANTRARTNDERELKIKFRKRRFSGCETLKCVRCGYSALTTHHIERVLVKRRINQFVCFSLVLFSTIITQIL